MLVKIEDINYSYGNEIVTISAQCRIYTDDGATMLHERGINASVNIINDPEPKARLLDSLTTQAQEVKDKFVQIMGIVQNFYPSAGSPREALALLGQDVEGGIV